MDNNENEEEHGGSGKTNPVICQNNVLLAKNCEEDLLHKSKDHVHQGTKATSNFPGAVHPVFVVGGLPRIIAGLRTSTFHCGSRSNRSRSRGGGCTRSTNLSNNCIRGILANHIRRVDHVELLCGILSRKGQNGKLTTRVVTKEIGDIQHHPAVSLGAVFGNLGESVEGLTTSTNCSLH